LATPANSAQPSSSWLGLG